MQKASSPRWRQAQAAELAYWSSLPVGELLRLCAEKALLLSHLDSTLVGSLFDGKEVLEIGVGPLGISLASFYPNKQGIRRLAKLEPLPQWPIAALPIKSQGWARQFLEWAQGLAAEGLDALADASLQAGATSR